MTCGLVLNRRVRGPVAHGDLGVLSGLGRVVRERAAATIHYTVAQPPPPNVWVDSPSSNYWLVGSTLKLNYGCNDPGGPGIASCVASLNGGPVSDGQQVTVASGKSTFTVTAISKDGWQKVTSIEIIGEPRNVSVACGVGMCGQIGVTVVCPPGSTKPCTDLINLTTTSDGHAASAARAAKRTHRKTIVVGKLLVKLRPGQTKAIHIALNAAGRRLLTKQHRLTITVTITQAGKTVGRWTITLKAKPARHKR